MLDIVVVDDETPIREWIGYSIKQYEKEGFHLVGSARSGKEALDLVRKHQPDVVITDIIMPEMDGVELLRLVMKEQPDTDFIILTNHAEFSYARDAVAYGARQYLLKSELRTMDLIEELRNINQERKAADASEETRFPDAYIDFYPLYMEQQAEDFCRRYLIKQGLREDQAYIMLGVTSAYPQKQSAVILDIAAKQGAGYVRVAFRQQKIYVILQADGEREVMSRARAVAEDYAKTYKNSIVIGKTRTVLAEFMEEAGYIETLMQLQFFMDYPYTIDYEQVIRRARLDREKVWREYDALIWDFGYVTQQVLWEKVKQWFVRFQNLHFEDIIWAREMCIKFMGALEEKSNRMKHAVQDALIDTDGVDSVLTCMDACRHIIEELYLEEQYSANIQKAIAYIQHHFSENISLNEVAEHAGLSPEYFSRLFKAELKENFSVYLANYRLHRARNLLKTTDKRIHVIAEEVGYVNPSYFSKLYRKYMGISPEAERNERHMSNLL